MSTERSALQVSPFSFFLETVQSSKHRPVQTPWPFPCATSSGSGGGGARWLWQCKVSLGAIPTKPKSEVKQTFFARQLQTLVPLFAETYHFPPFPLMAEAASHICCTELLQFVAVFVASSTSLRVYSNVTCFSMQFWAFFLIAFMSSRCFSAEAFA